MIFTNSTVTSSFTVFSQFYFNLNYLYSLFLSLISYNYIFHNLHCANILWLIYLTLLFHNLLLSLPLLHQLPLTPPPPPLPHPLCAEGDDYTKLGLSVLVLILEGLHAVCYRWLDPPSLVDTAPGRARSLPGSVRLSSFTWWLSAHLYGSWSSRWPTSGVAFMQWYTIHQPNQTKQTPQARTPLPVLPASAGGAGHDGWIS